MKIETDGDTKDPVCIRLSERNDLRSERNKLRAEVAELEKARDADWRKFLLLQRDEQIKKLGDELAEKQGKLKVAEQQIDEILKGLQDISTSRACDVHGKCKAIIHRYEIRKTHDLRPAGPQEDRTKVAEQQVGVLRKALDDARGRIHSDICSDSCVWECTAIRDIPTEGDGALVKEIEVLRIEWDKHHGSGKCLGVPDGLKGAACPGCVALSMRKTHGPVIKPPSPELIAMAKRAARAANEEKKMFAGMTEEEREKYIDAWATRLAADLAEFND